MPERAIPQLLARYGDEHLVLTVERLFISSTLREEAWLLLGRDAPELLRGVLDEAAALGIARADADRALVTYSGGEQVMLAILLTLAVVREGGHADTHLLLHNLLGSLSERNRQRMAQMIEEAGVEPLRLRATALNDQDSSEPRPA
jgi:hypothetical protein